MQKDTRESSREIKRADQTLIFMLKNEIYRLKQVNCLQTQDCRQYKHKYTDLLKTHNATLSNISRENSVKKQRESGIKQEKKISNFQFEWDKRIPNSRKFKVRGKRLKRISMDKEGAAMISLTALPKDGRHRVTFRISKNDGYYAISFGIITSKWKNQVTLRNNTESVFYYSQPCGSGCLTIDGTTIIPFECNGLGTSEGGEIEMIVDLQEWQIVFTRKESYEQKKARTIAHSLTESFLEKDLHVFVRMYNYEDEVEIA